MTNEERLILAKKFYDEHAALKSEISKVAALETKVASLGKTSVSK